MRHLLLSLALSLGLLSGAHGQKAVKARALLNKVYQVYRDQRDIDLQFNYELYNERADVRQRSKGSILVKGGKYALSLMGVERRFDGRKLYTIMPEDKEVDISSDGDDQDALTPDKLLGRYRKGYKLSWDIQQRVNGRHIQFIKLRPKRKSDTRYILLGIDTERHTLYKMIDVGKQGVVTTLTITAYKTNQGLSDARFTFNAKAHPTYLLNYLE